MKVPVFSIRDLKAEAFGPVFMQNTVGLASRMFGEMANSRDHSVGRHPDDFKLYQVGTFDDESGKLESLEPVRYVSTGSDYVEKVPSVGPRLVGLE